jgi:hypothetical protein
MSDNYLVVRGSNKKTRFCIYRSQKGGCTHTDCTFAHTNEELQPVLCLYNENCDRDDCPYYHDGDDVDHDFLVQEALEIEKEDIKKYLPSKEEKRFSAKPPVYKIKSGVAPPKSSEEADGKLKIDHTKKAWSKDAISVSDNDVSTSEEAPRIETKEIPRHRLSMDEKWADTEDDDENLSFSEEQERLRKAKERRASGMTTAIAKKVIKELKDIVIPKKEEEGFVTPVRSPNNLLSNKVPSPDRIAEVATRIEEIPDRFQFKSSVCRNLSKEFEAMDVPKLADCTNTLSGNYLEKMDINFNFRVNSIQLGNIIQFLKEMKIDPIIKIL